MRNDSAEALKPGFYAIVSRYHLWFLEKEEDGTIHQLTFEGQRDGVLDPEGWNHNDQLCMTKVWEPKR